MLALYKNIKARRLELKMSQDRLAELTGYKDRSSIAKIEKGEVDLAESKIREFAKALKITPQELMGWDDPDTDISIDETFERICEFYNILNPEGKAEALKRISELSQICNIPLTIKLLLFQWRFHTIPSWLLLAMIMPMILMRQKRCRLI